ncbi:hypothetical protein ACIBKZ_23325 [Streptomyces sp. NPDC050421]
MADSAWPKGRNEEVPDPHNPVGTTGGAVQDHIDSGPDRPEEPDRGATSWLTWIKLGAETTLAIVMLGSTIYGLVRGNGG